MVNLIAVETRLGTANGPLARVLESGTAGPPEAERRWHLWTTPPADGPTNMAVDAALLGLVQRTGMAVWRFYKWSAPTLSFGRNERTVGRFDVASIAGAGLAAVRRPTGGRVLLHAREVTYSACFPLDDGATWRSAYAEVNGVLARAFASLGVPARIAPASAGGAVAPTGPLCFALPSEGEIMCGEAKLVGSAVWRDRGAYLQHGSVLLHDDQPRILEAALDTPSLPPAAATLGALLPQDAERGDRWLASRLTHAVERELAVAGPVTVFEQDASLLADVAHFGRQFRSTEWLWRR